MGIRPQDTDGRNALRQANGGPKALGHNKGNA